jgi:hypothetical protein
MTVRCAVAVPANARKATSNNPERQNLFVALFIVFVVCCALIVRVLSRNRDKLVAAMAAAFSLKVNSAIGSTIAMKL